MNKILLYSLIAAGVGYLGLRVGFSQVSLENIEYPLEFKQNAFDHIINITSIGVHSTGTPEEKLVADYIFKELTGLGIETTVEKFEFESFDIEQTDLKINNNKVEAVQVCFNPYIGKLKYDDIFILLDSENTTTENIENRIVVASFPLENTKYFRLFFGRPKLVLVIPETDFNEISEEQDRKLTCIIHGEIKTHYSQNVVGIVRGNQENEDEIIMSAHYDSYPGSVGADDNGSGVGVLIELARFFKEYEGGLTANLKFVAFGGEEKGLLGSRAYLNEHKDNIENCKLLFNMDQIGAENIFIETTGGVQGIPDKIGQSQFPHYMRNRSLEGIESNWRLLAPEALPIFAISNRPAWLSNIIKASSRELLIPVKFVGNTGADQMTFAQAGIVATGIGSSGNEVHSALDVPAQINKQALVDCSKMAIKVVLKTMTHLEMKQ